MDSGRSLIGQIPNRSIMQFSEVRARKVKFNTKASKHRDSKTKSNSQPPFTLRSAAKLPHLVLILPSNAVECS